MGLDVRKEVPYISLVISLIGQKTLKARTMKYEPRAWQLQHNDRSRAAQRYPVAGMQAEYQD